MTDFSGFRIKQSAKLKDSLDRADLHIDALTNGMVRFVTAIPRRDGISKHYVFELSTDEARRLFASDNL